MFAPINPLQLSVAVGGDVSETWQSFVIVGSGSTVGTGGVVSFTVTVNEVVAPSGLLVQVTSVLPTGKSEPDAWLHEIVVWASHESPAVTVKVTCAPQLLASLSVTMDAGGVRVQALLTVLTVTSKLHDGLLLPASSVAVQVTVVAPREKLLPDGWSQLTVAEPLLSLEPTV